MTASKTRIANSLTRALGQQIVVENKSGANGTIGIEAAARSPGDGYTILVKPIPSAATRTSTR